MALRGVVNPGAVGSAREFAPAPISHGGNQILDPGPAATSFHITTAWVGLGPKKEGEGHRIWEEGM